MLLPIVVGETLNRRASGHMPLRRTNRAEPRRSSHNAITPPNVIAEPMRAAWRILFALAPTLGLGLVSSAAKASDCEPGVLGTSRVLTIEAKTTPQIGKPFASTLLESHEVILTFDDGPRSTTTARVLDALARQCVRAVFFVIGQNGVAHPELLRREHAEGHTIGYHTWSHPLLDRLLPSVAEAEIDHGIDAVERVLYGEGARAPATRFFRFPGLASSPTLLDRLAGRGIVTFGADFWASDWRPMTPEAELKLVMQRLNTAGRGIVLFHDTKAQTAAMLPAFLEALRDQNYRVVVVVPAP
jgi:peptidoglycan/xylan/chitin deacetylase (PgdA/CDA1 family)